MKNKLEKHIGKTLHLTGVFSEITFIKAKEAYSVLIKPVYMNGHVLCDHAWITISDNENPLKNMVIDKLDEISFYATVEKYIKSGGREEFGLKQMKSVSVVKKGKCRDYLALMQHFEFCVVDKAKIKVYGGESKIMQQTLDKPLMQGVYLKKGEKIECEFVRAHDDKLEFRIRTESMKEGYWIRKIYFNPLKNGQSISVRGYFSIILPAQTYSDLKRAYFKIFCTRTFLSVA